MLNLFRRILVCTVILFVSISFSQDFSVWYKISLRVHVGGSNLTQNQLDAAYEEINKIWAQAGIIFEIETVQHDDILTDGFDLWIDAERRSYNGIYRGQHDMWTNDSPNLGNAPNPVDHNVARTSAHELGHALGLSHYNDASLPDQRDNVMASGTMGWELKAWQVDDARQRAQLSRIGAIEINTGIIKLSKNHFTLDVLRGVNGPEIKILNPYNDPLSVNLLNGLGKTMMTYIIQPQVVDVIPVTEFPAGAYFISLISNNRKITERVQF